MNLQVINPNNPFLRTPSQMQVAASVLATNPAINTANLNDIDNDVLSNMVKSPTPFKGLQDMLSGLRDMVRTSAGFQPNKLRNLPSITPSFNDNKLRDMTMITPNTPGEASLDPFFQPSPQIPVNFLPAEGFTEIGNNGWTAGNVGTQGSPNLQAAFRAIPVSSSFGDNTLNDPAGTIQNITILLIIYI